MSARGVAWAAWAAIVVLAAGGLSLLLLSYSAPVPDSWGFRGFNATFALSFSTVGALIVAGRRNLVGWLLLLAGFTSAAHVFAEEYAIYGVLARPGSLPAAEVFGWIESWVWAITVALMAVFIPLFFPDGRLPSPRWRILVAVTLVAGTALALGLALSEGPLTNAPYIRNPFGIPGFRAVDPSDLNGSPFIVLFGALAACATAAAFSLVLRFRHAQGALRQQVKWLALASAIPAIAMILSGYLQGSKASQVIFIAALQLIPISIAVAILRYRLYDIDVLINRALVYGVLTAILAGLYTAAIRLFQLLFVAVTGEKSDGAIVLTTLVLAAAFTPLKSWLQSAVDRRLRSPHRTDERVAALAAKVLLLTEVVALGPQRGGRSYTDDERESLRAAVTAVNAALGVAETHR